MPAIRDILVPVDFSDTSRAALRYAADLAKRFDSRLHLLHVVADPIAQPWAFEAGVAEYVEGLAAHRENTVIALRTLATEEHLDPLRATTKIADGAAHHEILEYARRQAIDLIVMGTHGHGAFAHLFLGSVAERVVRHALCPVLVVPKARRAAVHQTPSVEREPAPAM
jgi:universal stress protein A